jgi:hypothetical protein
VDRSNPLDVVLHAKEFDGKLGWATTDEAHSTLPILKYLALAKERIAVGYNQRSVVFPLPTDRKLLHAAVQGCEKRP